MNEVLDKAAVITGAGSGIGRETAIKFASEGASTIVISDINKGAAEETVGMIEANYSCNVLIHITDVGKAEDIESLFDFIEGEIGGADILVNCAGICPVKPLNEMTVEDWDRTMDINIRSMFLSCRRAMQFMKNKKNGSIVNVSSISGRIGGIATGIDYATSKGAVEAFTKSLAKLAGPDQVRVNAIAPGFIETNMTKNFSHFKIDSVPLRRIGKPEEVADVILFLAGERSRYITGCTIDITGGVYMG